jgi:hypothetical protein
MNNASEKIHPPDVAFQPTNPGFKTPSVSFTDIGFRRNVRGGLEKNGEITLKI